MSAARRRLLIVLAAGAAAHLAVLFGWRPIHFDLASWRITQQGLSAHGLHVYSAVDTQLYRWPYPPLLFGWMGIAQGLDDLLGGHGFFYVVRLPAIAADLAVAALVHGMLTRRGATPRTALAAAAAVALGPVFVAVSSHQGQTDALAILPVVLALLVWEGGGERRALHAGLLIGIGACVKTVPLLALVALLPTVRDRREAVTLAGCAVALPLLLLTPFLVADWHGVTRALRYSGVPGLGGLSLVAQPSFPTFWLAHAPYAPNGVVRALNHATPVVLGAGLLALLALMSRRRTPPLEAMVLTWLTVYVLGVNFFLQYLIWGIPFFLAYGAVRRVAALQLLLLPALLLGYLHTSHRALVWALYTVPMLAAWAAFAGTLVRASRAGGSTPAARRAA